MLGQKEKSNIRKIIQLEEIIYKVLAIEGRLKRYWHRVKQYKQNRTFQNNERKFYQQVDTKTYQQPNARETERFQSKIWQPREHNKKSRIDKQHS